MNKVNMSDACSVLINNLPDPIKDDVLLDDSFLSELNLKATASITLGDGLTFNEGVLIPALRDTLTKGRARSISTSDNLECLIELKDGSIKISINQEEIALDEFMILSDDPKKRQKVISDFLSAPWYQEEKEEISALSKSGSISDYNAFKFLQYTKYNPFTFLNDLAHNFLHAEFTLDDLVPDYSRYYPQLIGTAPNANATKDEIANKVNEYRSELLKYNSRQSTKLLFSHAGSKDLTYFDALNQHDKNTLANAINAYIPTADPFGTVAVLGVCFHIGNTCNSEETKQLFQTLALKAIQRFDVEENWLNNSLEFIAGVFMANAVNLALDKLYRNTPFFWRQLVCFSHSTLSSQFITNDMPKISGFYDWVYSHNGSLLNILLSIEQTQSQIWRAEWCTPNQFRNEVIGRLKEISLSYPNQTDSTPLPSLIEKLEHRYLDLEQKNNIFLPGPLDTQLPPKEDDDFTEKLKQTAKDQKHSCLTDSTALMALINYARFIRPDGEMAEIVSRQTTDIRLSDLTDEKGQLYFIAFEVAHFAVTSCSEKIARNLCDVLIWGQGPKSNYYSFQVSLIILRASSAFTKSKDQYAFILEKLHELVTTLTKKDDAQEILRVVEEICFFKKDFRAQSSSLIAKLKLKSNNTL